MNNNSKQALEIWVMVVLILSVAIRVGMFWVYPPVSYSDTNAYRRVSETVLDENRVYDGTRMPGYPVFLALLGSDRTVYAVQLVLGLAITFAWFLIGWKASRKPFFGALMGLAHTLNPGQLFFEANLLTETLATFFLVAALLGAYFWLANPRYRTHWVGVGIGAALALSIMTRPVFIFMPVWVALCLAISFKDRRLHIDWKPLVSILLVGILAIGAWMTYMKSIHHVFSLTTMSGFHLVQHTGYYFEDAPDQFAEIRDIYLTYRDARIEDRGTQGNAIWDAIPAIMSATGYNFVEVSKILQSISVQLILTHPWEFLARILRGWWFFWRAPVYWNAAVISSLRLRSIAEGLVLGARGVLFSANLVFILTPALALLSKRLRQAWELTPFHWLLAGSVWGTSIVSSILDHGDNPRFLIPLQTAVVFWVLWLCLKTWQIWQEKRLKADCVAVLSEQE